MQQFSYQLPQSHSEIANPPPLAILDLSHFQATRNPPQSRDRPEVLNFKTFLSFSQLLFCSLNRLRRPAVSNVSDYGTHEIQNPAVFDFTYSTDVGGLPVGLGDQTKSDAHLHPVRQTV